MTHLFSGESSKPQSPQKTSFGRACGHQEDFGPKRRGDEATSGKVAKIRSGSRETN